MSAIWGYRKVSSMRFSCARCEYDAPTKAHYIRHLHAKKACVVKAKDVTREALLEQLMQETERKCEVRCCEWCEKSVAKSNYARHKEVCRKRPSLAQSVSVNQTEGVDITPTQ